MRVLALGKSRTSERMVTLFPEPDSPSRANTLPRSRENVTPFTALTTPSRVWNSTCKSLTVSSEAMAKASLGRGGAQCGIPAAYRLTRARYGVREHCGIAELCRSIAHIQ